MPADPVARPSRPDGANIVVIDDNHAVRDVVARALSGAGYRVMDWADPTAALDHLASNDFTVSLAVVDGVMPQMLGPDVAAEIELLRPGVPIMLMSGHEAPMFSEFFGQPGHHYIGKPFVIQDLVARIAAIIGPPPPAGTGRQPQM
jgi:two-component system, cell cycle sensor histidine kinase and response regulator CckA